MRPKHAQESDAMTQLVAVVQQGALGHLQPQPARIQRGGLQGRDHLGGQTGVEQLAGGDVHAHVVGGTAAELGVPTRQLLAGGLQHLQTQAGQQAGGLGGLHELGRVEHLVVVVANPQQGFGTHQPALPSRATTGW